MSFHEIASVVGEIGSIITFLCLIIKPIRDKVFGVTQRNEGIKCLLRNEIMKTYYKYKGGNKIPRYAKESVLKCYEAYVSLKGNSFVQDIVAEIREWEVI